MYRLSLCFLCIFILWFEFVSSRSLPIPYFFFDFMPVCCDLVCEFNLLDSAPFTICGYAWKIRESSNSSALEGTSFQLLLLLQFCSNRATNHSQSRCCFSLFLKKKKKKMKKNCSQLYLQNVKCTKENKYNFFYMQKFIYVQLHPLSTLSTSGMWWKQNL